MNIVTTVLQFIVNEILSQPGLLLGLITLIGMLALHKPTSEVITGTMKTAIGFLVLSGGAGIIIPSLQPLGAMVQVSFHLHGVVPSNEAILGLAQKSFGPQTASIMAGGFVVNLILARVTKAKYFFLTGKHMVFMSTLLAVALGSAGLSAVHQVILGSLILGTTGTVFPALVHPYTRRVP